MSPLPHRSLPLSRSLSWRPCAFSATGDDLIHDGIFLQAKQRGGDHYDFSFAYENMRDFYTQFDVNWLNQETLVNDAFAPSGYPMFSTPGEITDTLYSLGFRVFSLSNNHSYDKGRCRH